MYIVFQGENVVGGTRPVPTERAEHSRERKGRTNTKMV